MDDMCPTCSSDLCPQCGADMERANVSALRRQRDAAVTEYLGIVDAIDALGCPDDIATVEWVESLVRERDELRARLAAIVER